ncbi:MAG: hypothetical protein SPK88_08485 [Synergistales bacterium]|nr:hypothetical protein [Synergistales bacterium]
MEDELIVDGSVAQEENANTEAEIEIEPVIYTGPNISPLALQKFQVFKGGLPPYVKRAVEKIPEIKSLIVPVSELEAMRAKIEKSGTPESLIFYNVQKEAEKLRTKGKVKK